MSHSPTTPIKTNTNMEQDANKTTSESEPSIKSFHKNRVSTQNSASKVFARRLSIKNSTSTSARLASLSSKSNSESHSIKCVSYHRHDESSLSDSEQEEITQEWDNLKARNAASEEFTKSVIEARRKSLVSPEHTILSPNNFYTTEDDDDEESDDLTLTIVSLTTNSTELAELGILPDDTLYAENTSNFKNEKNEKNEKKEKNSNITKKARSSQNEKHDKNGDSETPQPSNSCTSQISKIDKTNSNQNKNRNPNPNSNSQTSFENSNAIQHRFSELSKYDSDAPNDMKVLTEKPLVFKVKFWAFLVITGLILYLFSENLRLIDYLGIVVVGSVFMYIFWKVGCWDDGMLKKLTEVNKIDAGYSRVVPKMKKKTRRSRREDSQMKRHRQEGKNRSQETDRCTITDSYI